MARRLAGVAFTRLKHSWALPHNLSHEREAGCEGTHALLLHAADGHLEILAVRAARQARQWLCQVAPYLQCSLPPGPEYFVGWAPWSGETGAWDWKGDPLKDEKKKTAQEDDEDWVVALTADGVVTMHRIAMTLSPAEAGAPPRLEQRSPPHTNPPDLFLRWA